MSSPEPVVDSSNVAELWRHVSRHQPRALFVGRLLLHHVEAPLWLQKTEPLDPVLSGVLRALHACGPSDTVVLDGLLSLGRSFVERLLAELASDDLAVCNSGGHWQLTDRGKHTLASGTPARRFFQRRLFHFVERGPASPPYFLAIEPDLCSPCVPDDAWTFPRDALQNCLGQADDWKVRHRFPREVASFLSPSGTGVTPVVPNSESPEASRIPLWKRVILDRAEQLPVALVLAPPAGGQPRWLGFALDLERYRPVQPEPVLELDPSAAREALGTLIDEPDLSAWRTAWLDWGRARGLAPADIESCQLVYRDVHLHVTAPPAVTKRLRSIRGGTASSWILAGSGPLQCAARAEWSEARPT